MIDRDKLYELLEAEKLAVVSSVNPDGNSQSAVVAITSTPRTQKLELLFSTSKASRKAKNIEVHPQMSVVVFDPSKRVTVQLEGEAKVVEPDKLEEYKQLILAKHPYLAVALNDPEWTQFVMTPSWARYTDISVNPWSVSEEKF